MTADKTKTPDGERTRVEDLNTDLPFDDDHVSRGLWSRLAQTCKNLSLFMAGMYTGLGCSGTPNTHHSYDDSDNSKLDIDRRIL